MNQYIEWLEKMHSFNLPRYEDLPVIPLYLDQVLEYINAYLEPLLHESKLTSAMINNYVKQKLMPAPFKKKYMKDHLAYIITITVLKQVTNISNIVEGVRAVRKEYGKAEAYNTFVSFVEMGVQTVILENKVEIKEADSKDTESLFVPMRAACIALAAKLLAEKSLTNIIKKEKNYE